MVALGEGRPGPVALADQLPKDEATAREIIGCLDALVANLPKSPHWRCRDLQAMRLLLQLPKDRAAARRIVGELYRLYGLPIVIFLAGALLGACGEGIDDLFCACLC